MTNPTNFYSHTANCPGHNWKKKSEDEDFEYYECDCGETDTRGKKN